jgi:hypothetical protein
MLAAFPQPASVRATAACHPYTAPYLHNRRASQYGRPYASSTHCHIHGCATYADVHAAHSDFPTADRNSSAGYGNACTTYGYP